MGLPLAGFVLCFPPSHGVVAQLGERLGRIEEVVSSILIHSTEVATAASAAVVVFGGRLRRRHPGILSAPCK